MISHFDKNNDHHANLYLFVGGISIVALAEVTLVKYYGIKENDPNAIDISNNLSKIVVDFTNGLAGV